MPGDLNLKKSWHPGLVKNQQKIWQQEQDALKEYQKIKERQKEIEDEREKEELIKLQYGNDLDNLPSSKKLEMSKLSWMYEEGGVAGGKKNESGFNEMNGEFLEGKQKIEDMLSGRQAVGKTSVSGKSSRMTTVLDAEKGDKLIDYGKDDPLMKIQSRMRVDARERDGHYNHRSLSRSEERRDRPDRDRSDRHRSDRHSSERHRSERHRSDRDRSDRQRSDRSSGLSRSHGSLSRRSSGRSHSSSQSRLSDRPGLDKPLSSSRERSPTRE